MKKNGILFLFLAVLMAFMVGCAGDGDSANPVILRGLIKLDQSITESPDNSTQWHANVKIYNVTANKVVAKTEVTNIQGFPVLYQIRNKFYNVYTEYWDEYKVEAVVYDESDDEVGRCSLPLDLNNYNYERNITVK